MTQSELLFERAQAHIPGGVNSPVRAFRAVGGKPLFIKRAQGAYLYDEDNNAYIELINSWGPMILGHASPIVIEAVQNALGDSLSFGAPTRREVEMAELLCFSQRIASFLTFLCPCDALLQFYSCLFNGECSCIREGDCWNIGQHILHIFDYLCGFF